jgi:SAM-dependent methyltransferase
VDKIAETSRVCSVYAGYAASGAAERWNIRRAGNRYMIEERNAAGRRLLREAGLDPLHRLDILEIGCGDGANLAMLVEEGADPARIIGIDIFPPSVAAARLRLPRVRLEVADASSFCLGPASVDLVILYTVFSSIRDDRVREAISARITKMVRPGGSVLWYDFFIKNPRNPHTRAIPLAEIRRHFGSFEIHVERITLFPPIARLLGPGAAWLYPILAGVPLLRGHYLGLFRRPCSA